MRWLVLLGGISEERGGIQHYSRHLLRALARTSPTADLDVLLLRDSERDLSAPDPLGIDRARIRLRPLGGAALPKIRFMAAAIRLGIARRPSWVLCGHVNFLPVAILLKRFLGIPYVLETYGWELQQVRRDLLVRGAKSATLIHAISRFTRDKVAELGSVDPSKIELVPVPVDFEMFTPGPKPASLSSRLALDGKKVLLTVSRLSAGEQYKGHDHVMGALRILIDRGWGVAYVVVGDGDDRLRLEERARALRLEGSVRFVGSVRAEDTVEYYRLCDLFVMPSRWEGFGIVYVEAAACGKPSVAGNADGARDALVDGKLGLLVDPLSAGDIADAIQSILESRAGLGPSESDRLRATARSHFSPDVFDARIRASLESVCKNSG